MGLLFLSADAAIFITCSKCSRKTTDGELVTSASSSTLRSVSRYELERDAAPLLYATDKPMTSGA